MSAAPQPAVPLEVPTCPLCGEERRTPLASRPAWEPYAVVRCTACGFAYLSPRPTEGAMRALYADDAYFEGSDAADTGYADYQDQELALRLTFRRWLRTLSYHGVRGESLLEVGCGNGYLLAEAEPWFAQREGTEFSPGAARKASKHADAIHLGGLDALPAHCSYDVVLSNQVIEHLHAPEDFLRAQLDRLHPGGALVVATPWMSSPWQKLLGRRWPSYKIPEHLLYFDRRSLGTLLHRVGLRDVVALSYPHAFPLALIGAKLGISVPSPLGNRSIWIPGTTLGMLGIKR